jgi:phosphate:Na+ symporter
LPATHVIINLLGEIALLLWGIHMVQSGVMRAFGSRLQLILGIGLKNRWRAFLAGLGITAVLQSSTATAMMAAAFTAQGVVGLMPALAVVLGANVGTTLIVQLLSFDITLVFPVLLFVGVAAFRQGRRTRTRDVGRIAIGLGLILLSLHLLIDTMEPVQHVDAVRDLLHRVTGEPLLNIALSAIFTWAAHSSVATMLFVMSLSSANIVSPEAALAMVLGANIGSAVNPVVEGASGDPLKLRLPIGNLANRILGCALALPFLSPMADLLARADPDPARLAANFHTGFNLAMAALFILPLPWISRLLERLLPARPVAADPSAPRYLDRSALDTPALALSNASREVLRMSDVVATMLRGSQDVFRSGDRKRVGEIIRMDDTLDRLHREIQQYVAEIGRDALDDEEWRRVSEILAFAINLEHAGDILDLNLMDLAAKKIKLRLALSREATMELDDMHRRLLDHLQLAVAVFMQGDARAARQLVAEKEQFRELERGATQRHFDHIREGSSERIEASGLLLDIVRDLKRIEAHLAATAYPLLEHRGQLKASRLVS